MKVLAILLACAGLSSASPAPVPDWPFSQPSCRWRLDENSCLGCTPQTYMDIECKRDNNGDYLTCVVDTNYCDNTTECDADSGTGECD